KVQKEFIELEETIKKTCGNRPVYYMANPGNFGDALIRYGTLKFLRDIGIPFTELTPTRTRRLEWLGVAMRPKGTLIFGGGGAWCSLWNHGTIVEKVRRRFRHVIVLPSTFDYTPQIPGVTYFCRDRFESAGNVPDARFCHDMAFYIGAVAAPGGSGEGFFFRTDAESSGRIPLPESNNDISIRGNHFSDVQPFFDAIAPFEVIHTDRLHVAIAACLMGRELHLYAGSYFKSRAIFASSIRDYFDRVHFHEDARSIASLRPLAIVRPG
ncbi:MAG: polysaccharide pyruvyl transferase family protein, partial [Thiogranum sp.]|nr:polysaccharide pyruvyl transferase family protein [Thiogranum sp.]